MRYTLGVASLLLASSALAQNNYALGPVESANSKVDVQILGQRFLIDSGTRCTVRARVVSKQQCVFALSRDTYAVVESDQLKLDRAAAITVLPFDYVTGASTVMIGARVTAVQSAIGGVSLGTLQVDQTALFANGRDFASTSARMLNSPEFSRWQTDWFSRVLRDLFRRQLRVPEFRQLQGPARRPLQGPEFRRLLAPACRRSPARESRQSQALNKTNRQQATAYRSLAPP